MEKQIKIIEYHGSTVTSLFVYFMVLLEQVDYHLHRCRRRLENLNKKIDIQLKEFKTFRCFMWKESGTLVSEINL